MDILKAQNINKNFANHKALTDVSITAEQGKIKFLQEKTTGGRKSNEASIISTRYTYNRNGCKHTNEPSTRCRMGIK